jgi:radical SAM superfamily enzyme YgiQ (UPF0313 family)
LLKGVADSVLAGEYEQALLELADGLATGRPVEKTATPVLSRLALPVPARADLPALGQYARYDDGRGRQMLAGYTEASRGCLHTCRHCPVVPVYGGRFFVVPVETVLADVRQQVAAGAEHITFGDPDFLNGPGHALKVARALHAEFPGVTFDFTAKVEHLLAKRGLLPELRALGASFVVSAFEAVSERVLARLDKGHTAADLDEVLVVLAEAGLPVQPTWVAFTPWTSLEDYLALLEWIRSRGLIGHVPAVQLSIRLLIPPGSALVEEEGRGNAKTRRREGRKEEKENGMWLGELDEGNFGYEWRHPDPCMDWLQGEVMKVAAGVRPDDDPRVVFGAIERLAYGVAGRAVPAGERPTGDLLFRPPRLTEDWFC